MLRGAQRRYGDTFSLKIAQEGTWVILSHPDDVRQVFTGDPAVLHAGEANEILLPLVGPQSVLLLDGERHMSQRKLMLPPFHGDRMRAYGDLMGEVARQEIERWPRGEAFPLWPRMQAVTLEVIIRAVFGVRGEERLELVRSRVREALELTTDWRSYVSVIALGPRRMGNWRVFQRRLDPLNEVLFEEIRERRQVADLGERDDILSLLLTARHEDGSPMTDEELRDELVTLLAAGHETTATALSWALERLVRHPEMLRRLADEARDGGDEYADAVVRETLRLRPVIPIVVRKLQEKYEVAGRTLPAGTRVVPCILLMHRRPDVYPEPERFRPERFLEQPAGTYTWIPFGGGVRRCLGASFALFEMRVVLQAVATELSLRPAAAEPERVSRRAITLTPSAGAQVVAA
jgi:cytochrome P450